MSSVSSLNSLLSSTSTSTSTSSVDLSSLLSAATGATSTGIDVTTAVAAAIYAAQAPERQWQAQQATIKSQITALTTIQGSLSTLSSDLDNLNDLGGQLAARAVSSSSSAVTATAAAGAAVGSHVVQVKSLAATASWYSPAVANSSTSLGALSMQIVGQDGTTHNFSAGSGVNTLTQLAGAINSSDAGVTASVVSDASGSRLALVGSSSGAANDFSVSFGAVSGSSWTSSSVASASSPLSEGSFSIGDGTQTNTTITVNAGDTLEDVANRINSAGSDVSASVVTDSTGSHLALTSATGTVAVSGDPTFSMQRASSGRNASLMVDGIPVSSATNQVSGVVSGVTFNLQGVTASDSQATLTVSADASQMASAISQFVTDYNTALSGVNAQFSYSATSSSQGALSGDSTVRSLQSSLMGMVGYSSSSTTSAAKTSLAALGITMGDDGSLTVNAATLAAKVGADPTGVQDFFQGAALNGFAATFQSQLKAYTKASTGALAIGISNLNESYTDLQSQVDDYESGYIASQRTVLTSMYSKAEIALQSLPATMKQLEAQLGENSGS